MRENNNFFWIALLGALLVIAILGGIWAYIIAATHLTMPMLRATSALLLMVAIGLIANALYFNPTHSVTTPVQAGEFTYLVRRLELVIDYADNRFIFRSFIAGQASKAMPLYAPRLIKKVTYYAFNIRQPEVALRLPQDTYWAKAE